MSTQIALGSIITHEDREWLVVRMVDSTTFFQTPEEAYLLEEKYAELRHVDTNEIAFKMFSQMKHPFNFKVAHPTVKGLDPSVWRKF